MKVSITTAEVMERLPGPSDWRRDPLVRYLSDTSGDPPPLDFLLNEAVRSQRASARAAGLYTLRRRYATDGMATYLSALKDRSGEVSLLAATAIAELGDATHQQDFFGWAQRRLSRKTRLNNWDMHELPALIQYSDRTGTFSRLAQILRHYHQNLSPDEHAVLNRHARTLLDPDVAPGDISSKEVDVGAVLHWARAATGTMFGDSNLEPDEIAFAENDIRDLLKMT